LSSLCGIAADLEQPAWLDGEAPFPAAEVLVARNGLLHLPSLVAGQPSLLPPTPAFFSANALDYAFDPTAECPGWLQFLGALWPEDPQAIGLLQEWLGYLLLPDTSQQKMLALLGPKRSGKGTIARVIRRLVGAPNVCAPTMSGLQAGFGLSPLLGKSVAIIGDARLSGRADAAVIVERLLSLTGEDALTVERKYREAVTTKLYARLILISNELPSLRDASGALASRMLVLQLVRSWYGTEDPDLTDRLLTELPGILNWSIGGWQRLRERGRFAQPDSGRELLESLEELASPVGTFVKECCWVGPGYHVGVKVLYDRWRSWCEETGRDYTGDLQHFGKNLRAVVPGLRLSRPRADQERVRFYEGIDLKLTGADF
jgi:putative DNA primase/helicase